MQECTETHRLDNGTVYKGQRFPDTHVAPVRNPDKFQAVPEGENVTSVDGTDDTPASQPGTTAEDTQSDGPSLGSDTTAENVSEVAEGKHAAETGDNPSPKPKG